MIRQDFQSLRKDQPVVQAIRRGTGFGLLLSPAAFLENTDGAQPPGIDLQSCQFIPAVGGALQGARKGYRVAQIQLPGIGGPVCFPFAFDRDGIHAQAFTTGALRLPTRRIGRRRDSQQSFIALIKWAPLRLVEYSDA